MHTVVKKTLSLLLLGGAVSGTAQAAVQAVQAAHTGTQAGYRAAYIRSTNDHPVNNSQPGKQGAFRSGPLSAYQGSGSAAMALRPGDTAYLNEANLIALANAAPAAGATQATLAPLSPVPEPPMYLMVLIGFGLVSLVARRSAPPPAFGTDNQ